MTEKYSFTAKREVLTHAYLYAAARDALEKAKTIEAGSFFQTMASLVFAAFTLEAYLNHVGEREIEYWPEIESIKTFSKLKVLYAHLTLDFDSSRRPIQTVHQMFKFRNLMAHGRSEIVECAGVVDKPTRDPGERLIATRWEEFCNVDEAERVLEDVASVVETLREKAGLEKHPLDVLGSGTHVIGKAQL